MTLQRYDVWEKEDIHKEPAGRFVELADVIKCLEKVAQSPHLNKIHLLSRLEVLREITSELGVPITTSIQKKVLETQDPR